MTEDPMAQRLLELRKHVERLRTLHAAKEDFVPSPEQMPVFNRVKEYFPSAIALPVLDEEKFFTVGIDASDKLEALRQEARGLQALPFEKKLKALNELVVGALPKNSVEQAAEGDQHALDTVYKEHPLSRALKSGSGCCRYQGALFFILGEEARLGESQFVLTQTKGPGFYTVYNVVNDDAGARHLVSIYNQTLSPDAKPKLGYPEPAHAEPHDFAAGQEYYGYIQTKGEPLIFKTHIRTADESKQWGKPIPA
jgi:hypothetical protein